MSAAARNSWRTSSMNSFKPAAGWPDGPSRGCSPWRDSCRLVFRPDLPKLFKIPSCPVFILIQAFAGSVTIITWSTASLNFSPAFPFFTAGTWCIGGSSDTA
jgi:hypothetical protein